MKNNSKEKNTQIRDFWFLEGEMEVHKMMNIIVKMMTIPILKIILMELGEKLLIREKERKKSNKKRKKLLFSQ